jgi:hypothetical protein
MSTSLVETALLIAADGLDVFPCGSDKRPLTDSGFHDASRDPEKIRLWFRNPGAKLIGVPTGAKTGIDVLDMDPRHGSDEWRRANIHRLPETRIHITMNGGEHWVLKHHDGVRNSAGKIAVGVDVRGEGGYVIWPGSPGYKVVSDADIAAWPSCLLEQVLPKPKPERPAPRPQPRTDQSDKRYQGYVRSLLANVSNAPDGAKHDTLLKNARALGGIIAAAGISEAEAQQMLMDALPATVEDWENAAKTAADGLRHGMTEPMDLEDRPKTNGQHYTPPPSNGSADDTEPEPEEPKARPPLSAFFDPWADPPPAEFPGGVLSQEMEDTVFATALRNGFCPGVLGMAYIAAASGAASKASRFTPYQNSTWWVPPIVWVMPIADSGQRKTAIEDIAFQALRDVHGEIWRQHRDALRNWKAIPPKERLTVPKPTEPHSFIVEDTGVEKLQVILSETDRGTAMVRDEIAGLLEFGRYTSGRGAAERAYYLQAYEANTYTVSRIGRDSIHIAVNGITLYGAIQPDRLKDFKDLDKDGLLQRINMVRTSHATSSRDDVIVKGSENIHNRIGALTRIEGQKYTTTPEGSALIRETEKLGQKLASIPDLGVGFQGTCSKLHGTHARYALVLHLLDAPSEPVITTKTIDRAGILIREFILPQARDFFRALTGAPQQRLRNIAGWILTKAPKRFLASDVTAGVWQCRGLGTKELGEALDPLVSGGWLEPETPFPSNRSWTLHPRVREAFAEQTEVERARCEDVRHTFSLIGRKT